jgi:hypothetical protein
VCGPTCGSYKTAPWLLLNTTEENTQTLYLRAAYWSMMSLTTTGHVDVVGEDHSASSAVWEVGIALGVTVAATLVFIYVNANCTSMMLRRNQQL